jgi:hypothetical protein
MTITYMTDMTYMNMTLWTNSAAKVRQCDKKKNRSGSFETGRYLMNRYS